MVIIRIKHYHNSNILVGSHDTDRIYNAINHDKNKFSGYCNKCQPGSYTNSESSLMCTLCDQYSIQPKEGMSQCERCPENAFADELRLQCIQCNIFETIDLNKQQCVYTQQFLIIVSVGCALLFIIIVVIVVIIFVVLSIRKRKQESILMKKENMDLKHTNDVLKMYLN